MKFVPAVAVLACVAAAPNLAHATCKLTQLGEVQVRMQDGRPLMRGQINGHPVELLADTGAPTSSFDASRVEGLGAIAYELDRAHRVQVPVLRLGTLLAGNFDAAATSRAGGAAGVLGADFFDKTDVEFDLANHIIRFLRPQGCTGPEVLYWGGAYAEAAMVHDRGDGPGFVVEVMLNGRPVRARLDTGAFTSVVSDDAARALGVMAKAGAARGVGREPVQANMAVFESFGLDQEVVRSASIPVADIAGNPAPGMLLGVDFFLSHRVLIANSQHKLFATYNGGPVFQARGPSTAKP